MFNNFIEICSILGDFDQLYNSKNFNTNSMRGKLLPLRILVTKLVF